MTSEQLEVARAERMRRNGNGTLTLEDARTWLEETGLCLFLPKRQPGSALAPSFVEAVAGQQSPTPDPRQIAVAEELLVRLENDGIAVRLNLLGQPGEQPDYVVAAWVLPYVYALRGDRDWRRVPQLTGSRQVSPLAIQAYKRLEANGDATIAELKQALAHGVSETAVLRAITELWQQLRIIPVISAPGKAARWQLLRTRYQKAIAEGASTSQVTAISVLASIFLQAVIAASMEEVEFFLSPLTARSKIREVVRGLVATRQVHTLSLGHSPHFYVAGTLPEFSVTPTVYASSVGSSYLARLHDQDDFFPESAPAPPAASAISPDDVPHLGAVAHRPSSKPKAAPARKHFNRPASHLRDRKPSGGSVRHGSESRSARPAARSASASRWKNAASKSAPAAHNGSKKPHAGERSNGAVRGVKSGSASWSKRAGKNGNGSRSASLNHGAVSARKETRSGAKSAHGKRPALAGRAAANGKRPGFAKHGTKGR